MSHRNTASDNTASDHNASDHSDYNDSDYTALDQNALDQAALDQTVLDRTALDHADLGHTDFDQTALDPAALDRTALDKTSQHSMALTGQDHTARDPLVPEPTAIVTNQSTSTAESELETAVKRQKKWSSIFRYVNYLLLAIWSITAAATTSLNFKLAQTWERQIQTLFFELRGSMPPPDNIVILTIDDASLGQGESYRAEPERLSYLEPIQAWPWKRAAYAKVIDKVMRAGAKTVALDVVFSTPSSYGAADDRALESVLRRYGERIVLAAKYSNPDDKSRQGLMTQLVEPLEQFRAARRGLINLPVEPDGRIHQFGHQVIDEFAQTQLQGTELATTVPVPFAEAILQAAQIPYVPPQRRSLPPPLSWVSAGTISANQIFYYGPHQSFQHIPFFYVLDPTTWTDYLESGKLFKDKVVVIGSTSILHQDFHPTPFGQTWLHPNPLFGVEVQANAVATLQANRAIADLIPSMGGRGLMVLIAVGVIGWCISRLRSPLHQGLVAVGGAIAWIGLSYGLFIGGRLIIPAAVPVAAIMMTGLSELVMGTAKEQIRKQQLRLTLKHYASIPIIKEIISQQDDLQDLLISREEAIFGKLLANRYRIVKLLGSGGFGEVYVSEDTQRPGNPLCVVKQLRLVSENMDMLKLMRQQFVIEAEALEQLGKHDQIPQLLAYFEEEQEFYLVQELINGLSLRSELLIKKRLSVLEVVALLHDLLLVLVFIHDQGVIHRDIKPTNVIRRAEDDKLVLVDFGIAKQLPQDILDGSSQRQFTVGWGTSGYMPPEQAVGRPNFSSDLYALGMMAIEALIGMSPARFQRDEMGEVLWKENAPPMSPEMFTMLQTMVRHDFNQRYTSANDALTVLTGLPEFTQWELQAAEWQKQSLTTSKTDMAARKTFNPHLPTPEDDLDADLETKTWSEYQ